MRKQLLKVLVGALKTYWVSCKEIPNYYLNQFEAIKELDIQSFLLNNMEEYLNTVTKDPAVVEYMLDCGALREIISDRIEGYLCR
jgi:hypothetical protein